VIETTELEVKRMGDVDLALARDEGEGFETLDEWREAHVRFFTSAEMVAALGRPAVAIDDDSLVVCSRFRVVELIGPNHARETICVDVDDPDEVRAAEEWLERWGPLGSATGRRTRAADAASTSGTCSAPTRRFARSRRKSGRRAPGPTAADRPRAADGSLRLHFRHEDGTDT
jgi:hypothetical protein